MPIRWTDDHCHLGWDGDAPADPALVDAMVDDAHAAGVERLVTVGTDLRRSADAVAAAARHPGVVWATVGLHPHDAQNGLDGLAELLAEPGVVAVGECGLDYHYDHSPRDVQRAMFAAQIRLAHERDLALVIHTREAWDDTFAILDAEGVPERTVFHCFTGGAGAGPGGRGPGGPPAGEGVGDGRGGAAGPAPAAPGPPPPRRG
ncbi:MAG: TatD family hydrolase, partial [Acidimicrobiales bacterium]|nr:TatD family hydrolase [Acidimicrobiales bacterium]